MNPEFKTNVDILGCCVSRDIISFIKQDFNVVNYFEGISPITIFQPHKLPTISADELTACLQEMNAHYPASKQKWILADINDDLLKTLQNSNSDWLILDIRPLFYELYLVKCNEFQQYVTYWDYNIKEILISKKIEITSKELLDRNSQLPYENAFDKLIAFIKKRYKSKVIIIDVIEASKMLDENGQMCDIGNDSKLQLLEHEFYLKLIKNLDGFYIKCPDNVIADKLHQWGPSSVHYISEYYDYAYDCIKYITSSCNSPNDINRYLDYKFLQFRDLCFKIKLNLLPSYRNLIKRLEKEYHCKSECLQQSALDILLGLPKDIQYEIANNYSNGHRTDVDVDVLINVFENMARKNDITAACNAFDIGINNHKEIDDYTFKMIQNYAKDGNPVAGYRYGRANAVGYCTARDLEKSTLYLSRFAEESISAALDLFDLYHDGAINCTINVDSLIEKYAQEGDPYATIRLSKMYAKGWGKCQSYSKAKELLLPLCEKNFDTAIIDLFDLSSTMNDSETQAFLLPKMIKLSE